MELWHSNFATEDRLPLFPGGSPERRAALHKLAQLSGRQLVLFSIVDDHVHLVTIGSRADAGRFIQRVRVGWRPWLHPSVRPAYYRRVVDRSHLIKLVSYLVRQPRIHGLDVPPALWEGSCFPDLLGARRLPALQLRAGELVPRLTPADIGGFAGLSAGLAPASPEMTNQLGAEKLVQAAGAALAIHPLAGKRQLTQLAHRAMVIIAERAGIGLKQLASHANCSTRTLRRSQHPEGEAAVRAVLLRLAISHAVGSR